VEGRVQEPSEWRAGPVVGWGCPACAARFFGGWDDAPGAAQPSPQKPPHGAEDPHPTPPARDAARSLTSSFRQKSRPFATPKPPARNELQPVAVQRQQEVEQAPAASKSLVRPVAQVALRQLQGASAQLETTGSAHASPAKSSALKCLPKSLRIGRRRCPCQTLKRGSCRAFDRGTSAFPTTILFVSFAGLPGRVDPCPTPTH
jgi:hypothetical protein